MATYVPTPMPPAEVPPPEPTYRSGYGPQPAAVPAIPQRPAPPPHRRRSARGPVRVLSYLLVSALAAVAAHLYWPKHQHAATVAAAAQSTSAAPLYTSAGGHFRARFPVTPTPVSDQITVLGTRVMLHGAGDSTDQTLVDEVSLSQPLAQKQYAAFLTGVLRGAAGTELVLHSERATTFRGHPARVGSYTVTADASRVSILAYVASSTRAYILGAPTGAALTALEQSFVALP